MSFATGASRLLAGAITLSLVMCAPPHRSRFELVRLVPLAVIAALSVSCDSRQRTAPVEGALVSTLAPGSLLALSSGATGAAYAIWSANDGTVHVARDAGSGFSPSQSLGLANPSEVDAAEDDSGRLAVFAITGAGELWLVTGSLASGFDPPLFVGTGAVAPRVAVSATGHVAMAWTSLSQGYVRVYVAGQGLGPVHELGMTYPHVWLGPSGAGYALGGYWAEPGGVWAERHCLDALGGITACDPRPHVPNRLPTSRASFTASGTALLSVDYTVFDPIKMAHLPTGTGFEVTAAGALVSQPAIGAGNALVLAGDGRAVSVYRGLPLFGLWPSVRLRPTATNPLIPTNFPLAAPSARFLDAPYAALLTAQGAIVVWATLAQSSSPPWHLTAAHLSFAGEWDAPVPLDDLPPSEGYGQDSGLAAVATGDGGGIFAWTRGGEVRVMAAR